ncbi:Hypothetical predicted protein [Paramuricea clavata]|uniref:Uncharacterized protein n=1 Tax=Paramuricea clavata TaxID=317549 RepID=A0A7D9K1I4_PARCT|nr:Hypothetical predicted protein [Paramuricea clavata]
MDTTSKKCTKCKQLIEIAEIICDKGFCELSAWYRQIFPSLKYQSDKAIRKFMQLPMAIFKLELNGPGSQRLYVCEIRQMVYYKAFSQFCQTILSSNSFGKRQKGLTREALDVLCKLASSESDRCLIKYSVCKSQGLSAKAARKNFGFNDFHKKEDDILRAVEQAEVIRQAVMQLASVKSMCESRADYDQPVAMYQSGVCEDHEQIEAGSTSITSNTRNGNAINESSNGQTDTTESHTTCINKSEATDSWDQLLIDFAYYLSGCDIDVDEKQLIEQSKQAYLERERQCMMDESSDIVSDSESDNPDDWVGIDNIASKQAKEMVAKQWKRLKQRSRIKAAKAIVHAGLLKQNVTKKVSRILEKYPNIGKEIEDFVIEQKIGADAWRRTGVLTFSYGKNYENSSLKVTYKRIREHLEEKYHTKFSHGTIVQLCVAINKRRTSAKWYKGVAKVTCRRARKGFGLKLNPDGSLQYRDV